MFESMTKGAVLFARINQTRSKTRCSCATSRQIRQGVSRFWPDQQARHGRFGACGVSKAESSSQAPDLCMSSTGGTIPKREKLTLVWNELLQRFRTEYEQAPEANSLSKITRPAWEHGGSGPIAGTD